MNVDNRLTMPVALLLAALECSFARIGCMASASADIFAAARSHVRKTTSSPPPPARHERIADVIVLSKERKHDR